MAAVKIVKIIVTLLSLQIVTVGSNSLYDLFRSPSSFFKIRQRRTNTPPLRFSSSRTQARILNKDIPAAGGQFRQTSSRRSDQYLEEPSAFFPSKPISFEPNFMQISDENSDKTKYSETRKLSNPLQFKSRINSGLKTKQKFNQIN